MADVTSPGHKLGQMVGDFFEELLSEELVKLCNKHGFYCDKKGLRPKVRGNKKKVTWMDWNGNKHDLDYVIEKDGSMERRGTPVAFIELAWRRYTKHSRNKTGELEGSLLPLRDTYPSCRFLGVILAGNYTEGGKRQLLSHGVEVLHLAFEALASCFRTKGVELNYPEDASADLKLAVIEAWRTLGTGDLEAIKKRFRQVIRKDYSRFKNSLEKALLRTIQSIRILPLFGQELVFISTRDAILALKVFQNEQAKQTPFVKFEIQLQFSDGDRIDGSFNSKEEALHFLRTFS